MTMTMTNKALKAMEESLAANQDEHNQFVREGETTFMRHDEIRVIQQRPVLVNVEFLWCGAVTYRMQIDCDFAAGQLLKLAGIEVRMAVRAS